MKESTDLKHRFISSLGWKLLEKGGSQVVKLIVQIVLARLLAPEEFGMLAIMLVFVNVGNVIVQSGLNTALIQDPDVTDADYSTVFWLSFIVSLILYVVVFVGAPYVAAFYTMPGLADPLRVLGIILFINAYNAVQIGKITRDLEMKKIFIATIASTLGSAVLGIGCAVLGLGVWALVIQQVSYQLINVVAHAFQISWHPRLVFQVNRAKKLFSFGWKLLVSGLLNTISQSLSSLIIGKQFSGHQLGLVSQGEKYPQALGSMLDGVIQPVMLSAIAKVQDDLSYARRIMRRALKTSTYLVFPAMGLFAVTAPTLVPLLLGEQWRESIPFFQMFCVVYALLPIHATNLQTLVGMGRSDLFLCLEIIKVSISVVCILIGAFVFKDIYCLVAAYIVAGILSTFVNAFPNSRVIGYSYRAQIRDIAPSLILTVTSCGLVYCLSFFLVQGIALLCLQVIGFMILYLGLSALIKLEEFKYLVSELGRRISGRISS